MDRTTTFTQALGRAADFLQAQQFAMVGNGWTNQAALGTATAVDGFTCVPTGPASLNVLLTPGAVYALANVENTSWSSLPSNSASQIVKQGLLQINSTIGFTPPGTGGFSQNFLIEVQYADLDTTPVLLPYYNASNPTQPFQGPNNTGVSQNTARLGIAAVQVKAGTAAATGTQTTPTADAGWTGLFVVIVANGQTTITAGNITQLASAPFIPVKLPGIPAAIQNQTWTAWNDSGTLDALVITPAPASTAYVAGQTWLVKKISTANATTTPTINVSGLGAKTIVDRRGNAIVSGDLPSGAELLLVYDGTNFRNMGVVAADFGPLHAPTNFQQNVFSTRTVLTSITGSTTVTSGSYTKKSATSNLIFWFYTCTYVPGAAGPVYETITIGGAARVSVISNNVPGSGNGSSPLNGIITGLGAGAQAWTLAMARADATVWGATVNPTSTDNAYFPAAGIITTLMIAEIEP